MKLPKIIAGFSLRFEEFDGEIAANHTFDVQNAKDLGCLGTDSSGVLPIDGVGQVVSLNALGIDAKHSAHKSRSGVEDSSK